MQYSKNAYGQIADRLRGVDRNGDNGWGGYQWTEDGSRRVPERLIGVAEYHNTLGKPLRIRIRRELVPLTVVMWQIAEAVSYCIHTTNPNGNGENWGPWGGEDRPMGGTKVASNHSRFRAEDDNAPYNPMVSAFITDMDPRYVAAREECGFYWGGRYNGKTDTMHFEYVGRPSDVDTDLRRAREILAALTSKASSKPRPPAAPPNATPTTTPAPAPAVVIPTTSNDEDNDMNSVRLVKVAGSDTIWVVDFAAHTKWGIRSLDELAFLRNVHGDALKSIDDVQAPWVLDGYRVV